jgi:hypothetical protein
VRLLSANVRRAFLGYRGRQVAWAVSALTEALSGPQTATEMFGRQGICAMGEAARITTFIALFCALIAAFAISPARHALGADKDKLVPPGRLVIEGRRLSCGGTQTLLRDFEGFAVSSTVIMLNMQALKPLPRQVQWLIYYHECGHILYGPSETSADCYAVRRARREGWLNGQGLEEICAVFNIAGHGPVHPDPEARCGQLRQCFAKKGVTARDGNR